MNAMILQHILDGDEDEEFNELMSLCSPVALLQNNKDDLFIQDIHNVCIDLGMQLIDGAVVKESTFEADEVRAKISCSSPLEKRQNINSNKIGPKRKKIRFYHNSKDEPSEFLDSDVDDEQIQKFLRSRRKRRLGKKLSLPIPDTRATLMKFRDVNHFEDKTDEEFFHNLRITKSTFEYLLEKVKDANVFSDYQTGGNVPVKPEQALQMFLYYMGHRCTYKVISDMFHVSESAIMSSFLKCVEGVNRLDDMEIRWPSTPEEIKLNQEGFKNISGLPGVVGSIGGCCVEMRTNKEPPAGYKIGKMRSIMYLLAVADAQMRFIYIQAGFPGTFCLQEAFESSSLGEMMKISSSSLFPNEDTHLIGSTDFTLQKHLIVPYAVGNLMSSQKVFNKKLIESNVCELAFTQLKSRFTSLHTQIYANLEKIPNIIKACCIIHNIALRDENDNNFLMSNIMERNEDYSVFRDDSDFIGAKPIPEAFLKRDALATSRQPPLIKSH